MKTKLLLLLVFVLTAACAFAQHETKRPFDRENRRERVMQRPFDRENRHEKETKPAMFSFREPTKPEAKKANTPIFALQSDAVKQRLDSVVWVNTDGDEMYKCKIEFTYDSNGKLAMWFDYYWENNALAELFKTEFAYDINGNMTMSILYSWENNAWIKRWKGEFTYDSNGNLTTDIGCEWNNNAWREDWKYECVYDNNGNLITAINYSWENSAWRESSKSEHTYDSNGNLIMRTSYYLENDAWRGSWKEECTYDSNGNLTIWIDYNWDWWNNAWEEYWKTEYVYDSNGNLTTEISYDWAWWNNTWIESGRTDGYVYDSNGNLITWIGDYWKIEYTYDSNGNKTMEIGYKRENDVWTEVGKVEFEFDLSVFMSDVFMSDIFMSYGDYSDLNWAFFGNSFIMKEFFMDNDFDAKIFNKITSVKSYYEEDDWEETLTFYYSEISTTNIPNVPATSFSIYPNPVSEHFTVSGITENTLATITDLNGRIVLQRVVSPSEQVSVGHLSPGVYFVKVNEKTAKMVKR